CDRARRAWPPGDERARHGADSPRRGVFVGGGDRGSDQHFGVRHAGRSALHLVEQSRRGGIGGVAIRSNREAWEFPVCARARAQWRALESTRVRARRMGGPRWGNIAGRDRKSTRLNSSHVKISYAVFCLKKKKNI